MTGPEIEKRKTELYSKYYGENSRTLDNLKMAWTKEDETEMEELSCRDMINSCLIYGSDPFHTTTKHWCGHGYCERSYMSDYEVVQKYGDSVTHSIKISYFLFGPSQVRLTSNGFSSSERR